jgi:hypothetical protein
LLLARLLLLHLRMVVGCRLLRPLLLLLASLLLLLELRIVLLI